MAGTCPRRFLSPARQFFVRRSDGPADAQREQGHAPVAANVGRSVGRSVGCPLAVRTLSARSVRPSVRRGQRVTWERWTMATPIRRAAGARIQFLSLVPINRSRLLLANFQASVSWREIHANFLSKKANILLIGERRNAKTVLSI